MSRKHGGGGSRQVEPEGWPVEWTFVGVAVLVIAAISQVSRLSPMLFVGQCTPLSGMCTPADCSCAEPFRRRELVTQDAQACFQCVADFCPVVAHGDSDCSASDCECEDPTWPRVDSPIGGQSCWQCIRPSLDFTARIGGSDGDSCLARVGGQGEQEAAASKQRLFLARSRTQCVALRYNGARITEKRQNESCLVWEPFGSFWALDACQLHDKHMQFEQLLEDEDLGASASPGSLLPFPREIYCSGDNASEFCIEVSENLCTEEDGRCSTERCRCEDPSWLKQQLQTLNGSQCFMCVPPPTLCPSSAQACMDRACECAHPQDTKLLNATSPSESPCFYCQAIPHNSSRSSEAFTLAMFPLCILAGLAVGGCIRRLRDPTSAASSPSRGKNHAQVTGSRTWSERLAQELEGLLEALWEMFLENPRLLLRRVRPSLRQVGKWLNHALDECDMALEPCYVVIDTVQDAVWDWVVMQHERIVTLVFWICGLTGDAVEQLSAARRWFSGAESFEDSEDIGASRNAKSRSRRAATGSRPQPSQKQSVTVAAPVAVVAPQKAEGSSGGAADAPTTGATGTSSSSSSRAVCPKVRSSPKMTPKEAPQVHSSSGMQQEPDGGPEDVEGFDWDPLGFGCSAEGAADGGDHSAIPDEILRRLLSPPEPQQQNERLGAQTIVQSRVQRKLQLRREALAQREATPTQPEAALEAPPMDDSWIDELEQQDQKLKASSKKDSKAQSKSKKRDPKESKDSSESAAPEDEMSGFDPDRLLGEAMHGLFLVQATSAMGDTCQTLETKGKKAAKKEAALAKKEAPAKEVQTATKASKPVKQTQHAVAEKTAGQKEGGTISAKVAVFNRVYTGDSSEPQEEPQPAEASDPNKKDDGFDEARRGKKGALNKKGQPRQPSEEVSSQQLSQQSQHLQKPQPQQQQQQQQQLPQMAVQQSPRQVQQPYAMPRVMTPRRTMGSPPAAPPQMQVLQPPSAQVQQRAPSAQGLQPSHMAPQVSPRFGGAVPMQVPMHGQVMTPRGVPYPQQMSASAPYAQQSSAPVAFHPTAATLGARAL